MPTLVALGAAFWHRSSWGENKVSKLLFAGKIWLILVAAATTAVLSLALQQHQANAGTFGQRVVMLAEEAMDLITGSAHVDGSWPEASQGSLQVFARACVAEIRNDRALRDILLDADVKQAIKLGELASDVCFQVLVGCFFTFLGVFLSWLLRVA